ncbi:glycosyltransferase family 2 protein [Clostridium thermarum]|uniref:glycosyltransferase family 2 protein n=1 Tax=Clostridium thermarum TaxID=1716543 RepID=UPI00111DD779|nr:glycosyltransferase [Clostridium thermarum]
MICSIIVPLYKGNKYIKKIIEIAQHWTSLDDKLKPEIIFVNDFPVQPIVLPQWKNKYNIFIKVIENQHNMGIHHSRIVGLEHAIGDYIVFLDQDDLLNENYLISQLQHLKDGEAVICNGLYRNGEKIFSASNPMKKEYSFKEYLYCGYPLVSLGQLLIKRNTIPKEWLNNIMIYNGWDDHFLWALMMAHNVKVNINEEILYVHEEDGSNASFNWKQMSLSGQNFRDIFLRLNLMNDIEERQFRKMIDSKIQKYEEYNELSTLFQNVLQEKLENYFYLNNIREIAIYGFGVYGKQFYQMLKNTNIEVLYCIDKRNDVKKANIPVISLNKNMLRVDAIVVSTISSFDEIKKAIKEYCPFKVISLFDILKEVNQIY